MIKLYGPARSSAGRCLWLLEELEIPYENIPVDMVQKEHKADWFLKINPNGKVPALVDSDENIALFESMAINYYLADRYRPEFLGANPRERALTHQWSFWAVSELQGPMIEIFIQKIFMPPEKKDLKAIEENEQLLPGFFQTLNQALDGKTFINGNNFTLADLNLCSVVSIAHPIGFDLSPYANIGKWMTEISKRPSFQRYMAKRSA